MDEQSNNSTQALADAISTAMQPMIKAFQVMAADITKALVAVFNEFETAYEYRRATGLPYDRSRIVDAGEPELLLLPERAESLVIAPDKVADCAKP